MTDKHLSKSFSYRDQESDEEEMAAKNRVSTEARSRSPTSNLILPTEEKTTEASSSRGTKIKPLKNKLQIQLPMTIIELE